MILQQPSRTFIGIAILLFAGSVALTLAWCGSMSAMHEMTMPGGWTMSMMWMRMPGQSWPGAAAAFLGMWLVMMMAMMLPSLVPMLTRYRRSVTASGEVKLGLLTVAVGAAYFTAWMLFGAFVFVVGALLATAEMQLPWLAGAVPTAVGVIAMIAGTLQFSTWKARHLACCRAMPACCSALAADARTAWRHGLRLGLHCIHCCFGLTAVLLAVGMMDVRAMTLVTAAICVERLAPRGERAARAIGVALIATGVILVMRAA